jgi:hypothetical protein
MEVIAEAYTIAQKSGVGQELVHEFIKGRLTHPPLLATVHQKTIFHLSSP